MISMCIREHLDLDMPWPDDRLLDIDCIIAEACHRLCSSCVECRFQFFVTGDKPHSLAASTGGRLKHYGIAKRRGDLDCLLERGEWVRRPGYDGYACS